MRNLDGGLHPHQGARDEVLTTDLPRTAFLLLTSPYIASSIFREALTAAGQWDKR